MKRMFRTVLTAAVGLCLAAGAGDAWAAFIQRNLSDLGRQAEAIFQGRVVDTRAAWNSDESLIHTYVTMEVDRAVKGRFHGKLVRFRVVGGEVGDMGLLVRDAATFRKGEEAVVLLRRDDDGILSVHGWRQGKHEIREGLVPELDITADHLAEILTGGRPDVAAAVGCPVSCVTSTPVLTWPTPAMGEDYLVNALPMAGCTQQEWLNVVSTSASTWNSTPAAFDFTSGGTTSLTAKGKQPDGKNVVFVGNASGALAITTTWYIPSTGNIIENDMAVSVAKRHIQWSCAAGPQPGKYDVESVVVHEFGHFLSLDDIYDSGCEALTMYGFGITNDIEPRTLEMADICGINSLY